MQALGIKLPAVPIWERNMRIISAHGLWRLFTLSSLIILMLGCSLNPMRPFVAMDAEFKKAPAVAPFFDNYWVLLEDLTFETVRSSDGKYFKITVPAGFVTDLASIPVPLNLLYDKTGRYSSAGILHDYLYWTQFCDRKKSDRLIKEGLKATGAGYLTRNSIKYGVYWFGWRAWNSNRDAKARGEERFVPVDQRRFPSNTLWALYKDSINAKVTSPWKSAEAEKQVQAGCNLFEYDKELDAQPVTPADRPASASLRQDGG